MLIGQLDPYIKYADNVTEEYVRATEFTKEGLAKFHRETGRYLIVTLMDAHSAVSFDMGGTYCAAIEQYNIYPPTGEYEGRPEGRDVTGDDAVFALADVSDVSTCISFFERGYDMCAAAAPKPVLAIEIKSNALTVLDEDDCFDEDDYFLKDEYESTESFMNVWYDQFRYQPFLKK